MAITTGQTSTEFIASRGVQEQTYAEAQWALVAAEGYRFNAGFMVSPDGVKFIPVPRGEGNAAKRASFAADAKLKRVIDITNSVEAEWLAKQAAK